MKEIELTTNIPLEEIERNFKNKNIGGDLIKGLEEVLDMVKKEKRESFKEDKEDIN